MRRLALIAILALTSCGQKTATTQPKPDDYSAAINEMAQKEARTRQIERDLQKSLRSPPVTEPRATTVPSSRSTKDDADRWGDQLKQEETDRRLKKLEQDQQTRDLLNK